VFSKRFPKLCKKECITWPKGLSESLSPLRINFLPLAPSLIRKKPISAKDEEGDLPGKVPSAYDGL
jgi:hypothetical protein